MAELRLIASTVRYALCVGLLLSGAAASAAEYKIVELEPHPATISLAAFSPDGRSIATGDLRGNVHVSDLESGMLRYSLSHTRNLQGLIFSPDGKQLWTCADDDPNGKPGNVRRWDAATGQLKARYNAGFYGKALVYSADRKMMLVSGGTIFSIDRSGTVRELTKTGLEVSPDGSIMFQHQLGVLKWQWMSALTKPPFETKLSGRISSVHCCPAAACFLVVKRDKAGPLAPQVFTRFDIKSKQESAPIEPGLKNCAIATVTPDARYAVVSTQLPRTNHPKLIIWDLVENQPVADIAGSELPKWRMAQFSSDQQKLAILDHGSGSPAGARVWDLSDILPAANHAAAQVAKGDKSKTGRGKPDASKGDPDSATKSDSPDDSSETEPFRTWTSANGEFTVRARLLRATKASVVLIKENGKRITVPLTKLSNEDRDYVKRTAGE